MSNILEGMTKNFNILVNKIKAFRIKYYLFELVRGFFITLFFLLIVFTAFSLIEYFFYLAPDVRKGLFYGFLAFAGLLSFQFIFLPLLRLLHVFKPIGIRKSAQLIQGHFNNIKDKLLNVIELSHFSETRYSNEILVASIEQKTKELDLYDFREAVQFRNLKNVLYYFLFSVLLTLSIFVFNQNIFAESTNRIIHYNTPFVKPAPYVFQLQNDHLKAEKGEPYDIEVFCSGEKIPKMLYINIGGNNYLMKNIDEGRFKFEIASVIQPVTFHFTDLKYESAKFRLELLPKPGINHFEVTVFPPAYTGIPNEAAENQGDLNVPEGTNVQWAFQGIDIDTLFMMFSDSTTLGAIKEDNAFKVETSFSENTRYHVYIKNDVTQPELALSYEVEVTPDLFPEIEMVRVQDSVEMGRYFFRGLIEDDYGFNDLSFHYNINNSDSIISIPVVKNLNQQDFFFSYNFLDLDVASGNIAYYFSVTDNDAINGYKTTTSDHFVFNVPGEEEIMAAENEQYRSLEEKLQQSRELAEDIQKDLGNLRMKNMDSNVSSWEKSQMVNEVLSKQKALEQLHEEIRKQNRNLNNYLNSFKDQKEEIKEKQAQIEDLLKEVFTDELKKLLEEFNKLAEEFNREKFNQLSPLMDLTYDDLQKQLGRNLEMLRKMKVEKEIQEIIDEIQQMGAEEKSYSREVREKKNSSEIEKKVSGHTDALEELKRRISEALEINGNLEEPLNFDDFSEEIRDVEQSMQESRDFLNKGKIKKSGDKLQQTGQKLDNLAFSMQQMLDSNAREEHFENIENLKQILDNLVYLSFKQEEVLDGLKNMHSNDPSLASFNQQQRKIKAQSQIVKDSLYALARRTPQLNNTVNNELINMEIHLDKSINQMEEARFPNARTSQQYVITAANNLALILNEALENLEKQMANAQPGDQQCENPGQGKPSLNLLKKSSENLKKQLEQMIDQMKQGAQRDMGKKMGQSLMQHEMMQQMLREVMNNGNVGSQARKTLQEIDRLLEENRKQLMNKNLNARMIARQNLINSRLLDATEAELEREFEDERESRSAEDFYSDPVKFFEYNQDKNQSIEYLNRQSHELSHFYNRKYKTYLKNIDNP